MTMSQEHQNNLLAYSQAIAELESVQKHSPKKSKAISDLYYKRAQTHRELQNYKTAIVDLNRSIAISDIEEDYLSVARSTILKSQVEFDAALFNESWKSIMFADNYLLMAEYVGDDYYKEIKALSEKVKVKLA